MAYTNPTFKMSVNQKDAGGNIHKIVVLGHGGVGKSALTLRYMYDTVSEKQSPSPLQKIRLLSYSTQPVSRRQNKRCYDHVVLRF